MKRKRSVDRAENRGVAETLVLVPIAAALTLIAADWAWRLASGTSRVVERSCGTADNGAKARLAEHMEK
jgi:hypothetical protein